MDSQNRGTIEILNINMGPKKRTIVNGSFFDWNLLQHWQFLEKKYLLPLPSNWYSLQQSPLGRALATPWEGQGVLSKHRIWQRLKVWMSGDTLQEINISHLGKRKIIFKMPFWRDMLVPWRVFVWLFSSTWWLFGQTKNSNCPKCSCIQKHHRSPQVFFPFQILWLDKLRWENPRKANLKDHQASQSLEFFCEHHIIHHIHHRILCFLILEKICLKPNGLFFSWTSWLSFLSKPLLMYPSNWLSFCQKSPVENVGLTLVPIFATKRAPRTIFRSPSGKVEAAKWSMIRNNMVFKQKDIDVNSLGCFCWIFKF